MTDIGEPLRRWLDEPLTEPVPGQPVPLIDDPEPLAPDPVRVEEPSEVPA